MGFTNAVGYRGEFQLATCRRNIVVLVVVIDVAILAERYFNDGANHFYEDRFGGSRAAPEKMARDPK